MKYIYNFSIRLFQLLLPVLGLFFKRLKIFYQDRKKTRPEFLQFIKQNNLPIIWVHVASLGEYEQIVPVIQSLKNHYSNYTYLISFFSDSGYRNKKNKSIGDFETYLPLDTMSQANEFVELVNPEMAIFVKYDIWPNYLNALNNKKVNTYLVAARFRRSQIYFKFYGRFFRKALKSFNHIFLQDLASGHLLDKIDFLDWTLSGDTRYDRVSLQLKQDNHLNFVEKFLQNKPCLVCGSTWPEDENVLMPLINDEHISLKYIIAPHQIKPEAIRVLVEKIEKKVTKYSEVEGLNVEEFDVLIVDSIGLLTKIYAYADIAYVGGGFGHAGLHNILEPAVFGTPIIIGPNHEKFPEAQHLQDAGGLKVITKTAEIIELVKQLLNNDSIFKNMSEASKKFISSQKGATKITVNQITKSHKN